MCDEPKKCRTKGGCCRIGAGTKQRGRYVREMPFAERYRLLLSHLQEQLAQAIWHCFRISLGFRSSEFVLHHIQQHEVGVAFHSAHVLNFTLPWHYSRRDVLQCG